MPTAPDLIAQPQFGHWEYRPYGFGLAAAGVRGAGAGGVDGTPAKGTRGFDAMRPLCFNFSMTAIIINALETIREIAKRKTHPLFSLSRPPSAIGPKKAL
jgi:hypothetical protein